MNPSEHALTNNLFPNPSRYCRRSFISRRSRSLRRLLLLILVSGVIFATSAKQVTAVEVSRSVTLASQYLWRGFDLSQEDPVVQGDISASFENGFSVTAWGSQYDIGSDDGIEVDLSLGYQLELSEQISLAFGFTEYTYSGQSDSTSEYSLTLDLPYVSFGYFNDQDLDAEYLSIDSEFPLADKVSLLLHAGNYRPEGLDSINEFSLAASYQATEQLAFLLAYSDNELNTLGADDYLVASASYSF